MFINDKLTNLMTKFFCKFFKIQILVKTFLTLTVFILFGASFFLSLVEAQNTNEATTIRNDVETASPPCSVYDLNWGTSFSEIASNFGAKGLYNSFHNGFSYGSLNDDQKNKLKKVYDYLKKDPIFLTIDGQPSGEDPIVGLKSSSFFDFNSNEITLPCVLSGSLNGLVARRNDADTNFTNCDFEIVGSRDVRFRRSAGILCKKDSQLYSSDTGGCVLEMAYVNKDSDKYKALLPNSISADMPASNSLYDVSEFRQNDPSRENGARGFSAVRLTFSTDTFLKKTTSNSDLAKFKQGLKNYPYIRSDQSASIFSSIKGTVSNDTFQYQSTVPNFTSSELSDIKTEKKSKFMFNPSGFPNNTQYGEWLNTSEGFDKNWSDLSKIDSNELSRSHFNGIYYNSEGYTTISSDGIPNVYENPYALSKWIDKTSFKCEKRDVTVTTNDGKTISVPIYEWIPTSFLQLSAPTCSSVGAGVSKVIPQPSAIAGKHYLVCTPCVVPAIFQTDIFGQPVFGIPTSIGCLPSSINGIISVLIRIASITAGGLAVLIITISGMRIMLNTGDPEEVKKAQKAITSAIVGLLVIISSVFLLNLIGVKILDLSSFGGNELEFKATSTS